jgi:hypothetical protein
MDRPYRSSSLNPAPTDPRVSALTYSRCHGQHSHGRTNEERSTDTIRTSTGPIPPSAQDRILRYLPSRLDQHAITGEDDRDLDDGPLPGPGRVLPPNPHHRQNWRAANTAGP